MAKHLDYRCILGFPTTFAGDHAFVHLHGGAKLVFHKVIIEWIVWLFPTGRLHVHHDGEGRRYIDLTCEKRRTKRISVARLVLCLLGEPEQKNRQAHYRDKDRENFLPENLYLGGCGPHAGSDDTWQEVARREDARQRGLEPDGKAPGIIGSGTHPPHKWVDEPALFPPVPVRQALRERMLKVGVSGAHA